jgi:hypothetical protein
VISSIRAEAGIVPKHKSGDFEVQDRDVFRYLVYLTNRAAGKGSVKTIDLRDQKRPPLTPKSFIYNRQPYSQVGYPEVRIPPKALDGSRLTKHFSQLATVVSGGCVVGVLRNAGRSL